MQIWMASKRGIRRRSCNRKVRFNTMSDARIALTLSRKTGRFTGTMRSYGCNICGGFHNGHVKGMGLSQSPSFNKRGFNE